MRILYVNAKVKGIHLTAVSSSGMLGRKTSYRRERIVKVDEKGENQTSLLLAAKEHKRGSEEDSPY